MTYLLDTSACVDYMRRPDSGLRVWLSARNRALVQLCSVVEAELWLGVRKRPTERNYRNVTEFLAAFECYPFDRAAAKVYADIRADLERKGEVVGPNDMLIAAIAVSRGATLVTGNAKEFRRISSLTSIPLEELAHRR